MTCDQRHDHTNTATKGPANGLVNNAADGYLPRNALSVAQEQFRQLVTRPDPLSIDGTEIGHSLPARLIDLEEVKALLLDPHAHDAMKDAVWAYLVRRARVDGSSWVIGCVGVAMPGLKNLAARTTWGCSPHVADDVVSELVTEFVARLSRIDLDRRNIAPRLLLWARKGALRARARERAHELPHTDPPALMPHQPAQAADPLDPSDVLAEAVQQRVITLADAQLINMTRLEGLALREYAKHLDLPADRLYKRRRAAETRLAQAIREGQVSVSLDGPASNSGS